MESWESQNFQCNRTLVPIFAKDDAIKEGTPIPEGSIDIQNQSDYLADMLVDPAAIETNLRNFVGWTIQFTGEITLKLIQDLLAKAILQQKQSFSEEQKSEINNILFPASVSIFNLLSSVQPDAHLQAVEAPEQSGGASSSGETPATTGTVLESSQPADEPMVPYVEFAPNTE